jgi:lactate dehydrogenase-like 2-hydroxyacid dehydrogenase
MSILLPDAFYDDDAAIEREVLGPRTKLVLSRQKAADQIGDDVWREAEALIVLINIPIDAALIAKLENCRIIVRAGVGYDHIDVESAGKRGIPVCNVPDYGTTEVADHAIALMLGLARGLVAYHQRLISDPVAGWQSAGMPLVRRLRHTRFGVVGLGRIGNAAARRARGLDMEVAFYDPYLPDGTELGLSYRREISLEALLAGSDVVSLHCPLTEETRAIIDARAFQAIKPGALLINTARGALIDIDALEQALRDERLDGVGLDVLPTEPPAPDHPLIQAFRRREPWIDGKLLLTPHAAWYSPSGQQDLRRKAAATVADYLQQGELRNLVNGAWLKG